MALRLEINKNQLSKELALHYLPARVEGDGEANVEEYFNNYTVNDNGHLTNALRGFPLDGGEFVLPKKFRGVILQETKRALNESSERVLRVTGTFESFTYWNYDKVPSAADALRQALQVNSVAEELTKPISYKDIEREMRKHT